MEKSWDCLDDGACFGETSYVHGAKRTASIRAASPVTILRVSSTLMEQVSSSCQLRFNKVFLRALITRLQGDGIREYLSRLFARKHSRLKPQLCFYRCGSGFRRERRAAICLSIAPNPHRPRTARAHLRPPLTA